MSGPQRGWLRGIVKEVPSGDTVVVMAATKSGIPPEKRLTLASLIAPRLGRRDGSTRDEPFAWQSREFLRKLCVGKPCVFRVEYTIEAAGNREFGSVFINERDNIALASVSAGWTRVRPSGGQQSPFYDDLVKAQDNAESHGIGVFSKLPSPYDSLRADLTGEFDAPGFLERHGKGKPISAIVEAVNNGSTLRVTLLPSLVSATVIVAGVQCPSMAPKKKAQDDAETASPPEPFAKEARHFTEIRCLNKDVTLILEGTSQFGVLVASVRYPPPPLPPQAAPAADGSATAATATASPVEDDLGSALARCGLAKLAEWSLNMMTSGAFKLRETERAARQQRLGMWHSYVPPATNSSKLSDTFVGTVSEIVSGDVILVRDASNGIERRVTLSSIRAPRLGSRDRPSEPWAAEAKEFLRQRLIGKEVSVSMEYTRKVPVVAGGGAGGGATEDKLMAFGTVTIAEKAAPGGQDDAKVNNVAELLLVRGLAQVVKHRGDEERSAHYEDLVKAEDSAKKSKKGQFSSKEPPAPRINDVTTPGSSARARQYLPFLQRAGKVRGICEFVLGGSRFKIHVPKEGVTLAFSPSAVRCPSREEPFAAEALAFTRSIALQREVELEVSSVDKAGTFLGTLHVLTQSNAAASHSNGTTKSVDLSVALLESGLATLHASYMDRNAAQQGSDHLARAQDKAKKAKLKIWENYQETTAVDAAASAEDDIVSSQDAQQPSHAANKDRVSITVTDVIDANTFYVQLTDTARVDWIADRLSSMNLDSISSGGDGAASSTASLKANDICLAKFSVDGRWYRGCVESIDRSDPTSPMYDVYFVDYGNKERQVPSKDVRAITPDLKAVQPQAHLASLAYVKAPGLESEYGVDGAQRLSQLVGGGRRLQAIVEGKEKIVGPGPSTGGATAAMQQQQQLLLTVLMAEHDDDGEDARGGDGEYAMSSVNYVMVSEGLARVKEPKSARKGWGSGAAAVNKVVDILKEAERNALKSHAGLWRYGDPGDDDDEDDGGFPSLGGKGGKR